MKKSIGISLITYISISLLLGCGPTQESYKKLKAENEKLKSKVTLVNKELENIKDELNECKTDIGECRTDVEELKNTPIERLSKAREFQKQGKISEAERELNALITKYPDSKETQISENILAEIKKKREEERIAQEKEKEAEIKRKRLGFKALKVQSAVEIDPIKLKVNSVKYQNRWIADRHNSQYHYSEARRGYKFIVVEVSISSEVHNPELPAIQVYAASSDKLSLIDTLDYRFYRWDDYGSYLGNDPDFKNDFSRTKTIRFSAGLEISEEKLNKDAILVFVNNDLCFIRKEERFSKPAVKYSGSGCTYEYYLDLDEAEKGYSLIKIFNQNKL